MEEDGERLSRLEVVVLINRMGFGGAETDVLALSRGLVSRGHGVTVVAERGPLASVVEAAGARLVEVPLETAGPVAAFRARRVLVRLLHERRVNVLNPQSLRATMLAAIAARSVRGRRPLIVTTLHNVHDPAKDRLAAHVLNSLADRVIVVSDYERRRLVGLGLRASLATTIHSGIARAQLELLERAGSSTRASTSVPAGEVVLSLGRLSPEKRVEDLLNAMAVLARERPGATLVIAGDGSERRALEAQASRLGLDQCVQFLGFRTDTRALLERASVLVLSSERESLPRVLKEAMVIGTPVVATRVGGVEEATLDGVTGILVPPRNPEALARAIGSLLADPARRARMSKASREEAQRRFSVPDWLDRTEAVFREAHGNRS